MFTATRALRQAAAHAERVPSIRFLGRRSIPESVDHTPHPHPASPTGTLPEGFGTGIGAKHSNFSSYRQHAQQHGPLQKSIRSTDSGIGGTAGADLGAVGAPKGLFFDVSELPARFHRRPIPVAELEAVESGGASVFG